MIVWDEDTMSTGVLMIDEQHKELFAKFNEFSRAISKKSSVVVAGRLLEFLQYYAAWHFGQEENCMNEYKCPIAAENKQAHAEFVSRFGEFHEQWRTGNVTSELMDKTYVELEQWLLQHVARVDTQLRSCVKN